MSEKPCKICGGDHPAGFCATAEGREKLKTREVGSLAPFDQEYFEELKGKDGWIALGQEYCSNARYFSIMGEDGEKLGIVGVYDTENEKNVTHTVVDSKYRGQGIAGKAKMKMMEQLGLHFLTMTVDLDNAASLRAVEKMEGVVRTSDETYEHNYHKARFEYRPPVKEE